MSANFRDPKLFSKLVNKKKVNNSGYTTMLKYDDIEYRGDAQGLARFFSLPQLKIKSTRSLQDRKKPTLTFIQLLT